MKPFTFSNEAALFAREYDVVEAMRIAWAGDMSRYFNELHAATGKEASETVGSRVRDGQYRYWWLKSGSTDRGRVTLFYADAYPQLIRDHRLLWWAYIELAGGKHAPEGVQKQWVKAAKAAWEENLGEIHQGPEDSFKPMSIAIAWTEDPLSECAVRLARVLKILGTAWQAIGEGCDEGSEKQAAG